MEDQAAKLTSLGLRVGRIHSGLERAQARQTCQSCQKRKGREKARSPG